MLNWVFNSERKEGFNLFVLLDQITSYSPVRPPVIAGIINRKYSFVNFSLLNPSAAITFFHLSSSDRVPVNEIIRYIEMRK